MRCLPSALLNILQHHYNHIWLASAPCFRQASITRRRSLDPCVLGLGRHSSLQGLIIVVDARLQDALLALLVTPQRPLQALLLRARPGTFSMLFDTYPSGA